MRVLWKFAGVALLLCAWPLQTACAAQGKSYSKSNVSSKQATKEADKASSSVGLGSVYSLGDDPCGSRGASNLNINFGKDVATPSAGEVTGMPRKPVNSAGKSGQMADGADVSEADTQICTADNVTVTDPQGNAVGSISYDPKTQQTTVENQTKQDSLVVVHGDDSVTVIGSDTKATFKYEDQQSPIDRIERWAKKTTAELLTPSKPSTGKVVGAGVRGSCDPYGVTGGCSVEKGDARFYPSSVNPMKAVADAAKKGQVTKARWAKVNPGPEGAGPSGGPRPAQTQASRALQAGGVAERAAKTQKGGQVTNPRDDSGGGGAVMDVCGHYLGTPRDFAAARIDPSKLINPGDFSLNGWNSTLTADKSGRLLVWTKAITRPDGSRVAVERSMRDGKLVSLSYVFTDKSGARTGSVLYDAGTGKLAAQRLK